MFDWVGQTSFLEALVPFQRLLWTEDKQSVTKALTTTLQANDKLNQLLTGETSDNVIANRSIEAFNSLQLALTGTKLAKGM